MIPKFFKNVLIWLSSSKKEAECGNPDTGKPFEKDEKWIKAIVFSFVISIARNGEYSPFIEITNKCGVNVDTVVNHMLYFLKKFGSHSNTALYCMHALLKDLEYIWHNLTCDSTKKALIDFYIEVKFYLDLILDDTCWSADVRADFMKMKDDFNYIIPFYASRSRSRSL